MVRCSETEEVQRETEPKVFLDCSIEPVLYASKTLLESWARDGALMFLKGSWEAADKFAEQFEKLVSSEFIA